GVRRGTDGAGSLMRRRTPRHHPPHHFRPLRRRPFEASTGTRREGATALAPAARNTSSLPPPETNWTGSSPSIGRRHWQGNGVPHEHGEDSFRALFERHASEV